MTDSSDPAASPDTDATAADFTPVELRKRHDGWTPARQIAFIQAIADTACIDEACRRVGMSTQAAYALRRRPEAVSFRQAWDVALDFAVARLADAAVGRALNGVATPVFYKGEQIGERRRYDERLTMFVLRYRNPQRFGAWMDGVIAREPVPDAPARRLAQALKFVAEDGLAAAEGRPLPVRPPLRTSLLADNPDEIAAMEAEEDQARIARLEAEDDARLRAYRDTLAREAGDSGRDVP